MMTSFYSGLTGLSAYANALNIVGNNLANINTTAFKSSVINFEDLVTNTFGGIATSGNGNPMQIGLGTLPSSISGVFSQGSIQNTSEATNVAIEGNGFFIVGDTVDDRFYTRAGNFSFDREGYLVNPAGKFVLGYTDQDANGNLVSSGPLSQIFMPSNTISPPSQTTLAQIFSNLNVRDDINDTYSSSITIYDSKGAPHTLTFDFTHWEEIPLGTPAPNFGPIGGGLNPDWWNYTASVTDGTVTTNITGTLEFDGGGQLSYVNGVDLAAAANPYELGIDLTAFGNGADDMTVNWRLTDDNGTPLFTGYPIDSTTSSTNADGYPPGTLTSLIIDNEGIIEGVFSNGQVEQIAQIATSVFNNPKGLLRLGRNLYSETNASGNSAVGAPGTGGRGTIIGNALEASNVDIAQQFTDMIIFERGYQANARIITTSDEVIQQALALKR